MQRDEDEPENMTTLSVGHATAPKDGESVGESPEVKIHSILCNRASAWASRIYENIGSEASSMQRAESAMRQALQGMNPNGDGEDTTNKRPGDWEEEEGSEDASKEQEAPSPDTVSISIAPVVEDEEKLHISWKCGVCGYHVLAMDQNGNPLPLSRGAYGELLPIRCPRCEMEHTSWEQAIPFDKHGDHVNIRSTLSNNYVTQCRKRENAAVSRQPPPASSSRSSAANCPATGSHQRELPPILANIGRVTYKDGEAVPNKHAKPRHNPVVRMAFYCSLCGRRLLRVDAEGELVAMDVDAKGEVLPIRCPGCNEVHNRWEVKPFTVGRMNVMPKSSDKSPHHTCVEPLPTW